MKRFAYLAFVLAVVLCVEGCRRNTVPRKPVPVFKEKDFMYSKSMEATLDTLKPPPKDDADGPEGEMAAKIREAAQKAKEQEEKNKRKLDTFKLGQTYLEFCREVPAKNQTYDTFKTFVRRRKLTDLRAEVEGDKFGVVLLSVPTYPGQILVYHKSAEDGIQPVYLVGQLQGAGSVKETELDGKLKKQELVAMWRHVWDFARPHYVTTPANPADAKRLELLLNQFEPSRALATVAQQMPEALKKTPEARNPKKFKRYLEENVPPDFLKAYVENKLRVNVAADFRSATDLVVCLGEEVSKEKGTEAISTNGLLGFYPARTINDWFKTAQ